MSNEDEKTLEKFIAAQKINYAIAVDDGGKSTRAYQISAYPTAYLIGPTGKILGPGSPHAVEQAIKDARMYFQQDLTGKLKSYKGTMAKKQYGKAFKDLEKLLPQLAGTPEETVAQSLKKDLEDYAKSYQDEADTAIKEQDLMTAIQALQQIQTLYKDSAFEKQASEQLKGLQKGEETKNLFKGATVLITAQQLILDGKEAKAKPLLESVSSSFPNTTLAKQAQGMLAMISEKK